MNEATIAKKQAEVERVSNLIADAGSTVFVDYLGLTVAEVTELRVKLQAENCQMEVIKNNILRRAAEKAGYDVPDKSFIGPSAVVFSADEVTASKIIYAFLKGHDKLTVKSGIVDKKTITAPELKQLAALPNKEGMISMLLSVLQAPIRGLACVLKAKADQEA